MSAGEEIVRVLFAWLVVYTVVKFVVDVAEWLIKRRRP